MPKPRPCRTDRPLRRLIVLVAALSLMLAGCAGSQPRKIDDESAQRLVRALVDAGAVGAVAEVRWGSHTTQAVAGTASPGGEPLTDPQARTRVLSITKSMVAVVILQLAQEGALALDEPASRYLPELAPGQYTVRQLLQHTSGVGALETLMPATFDEIIAASRTKHSDEELIRVATTKEPVGRPGQKFAYSNANYVILAQVAEKVTGRRMADLLKTRVFQPAGMAHTSIPTDAAMPAGSLRGYLREPGRHEELTEFTPTLMSWGGNVISTTGDLNRFYRAAFDGTLLSRDSAEQMRTSGQQYFLGLLAHSDGCGIGPLTGKAFGNRGNGYGYAAASFHSPDGQRQVTLAWSGTGVEPASDPIFRASLDQMTKGLALSC